MQIAHVTSEFFPYAKTGGLADAVSALCSALAQSGHTVSVFLPGYSRVFDHRDAAGARRIRDLGISLGGVFTTGEMRAFTPRENLTVYLICRDEFFDRNAVYGTGERDFEDNSDRFIFFCQAVVEALRQGDVRADIVHCHDWEAALVPVLLREAERGEGAIFARKTIFTIHNIAYQGVYPPQTFARTNLRDDLFQSNGLEFYGQVNFVKAGILFADHTTTVSPTYAREIMTPEYGCGLDGVLCSRADRLTGILNGVDISVWHPTIDACLPARYSRLDMAGKQTCRTELLKRCQFDPAFAGPIFAVVSRFTEQKGINLLLANRDFFLVQECRLVVLGSGDRRIEKEMLELSDLAPHKVFLAATLDEALSHLINAGSDFFLMPSVFEPCGLYQMYSQLFGTVPVVTRVGGLADTVVDAEQCPANGTGIVCEPSATSVNNVLHRALMLFADQPRYHAVQQRGMSRDFSWAHAAAAYLRLYEGDRQ